MYGRHSGIRQTGSRARSAPATNCAASVSSFAYRAGRSGPSATRAAPVSVAKSSNSFGVDSAA